MTSAPTSSIEIERRDEIAIITLCNPKKRNALDPAMLDALVAAFQRLPSEGARAVVLTGTGDKAFSAGYDITALSEEASPDPNDNPLKRALDAIADGPLPVVAALNGVAIGGGCELAATCDLRVAHVGVTLTMPPVRLGLIYSSRGLQRFVALIGLSRTRELFLTATPVEAERALAWGLVDRVVDVEDVVPVGVELARAMAQGAPLAIAGTRKVLERLLQPLDPAVERELGELQRRAWTSDDAREARLAFREKRPPRFRGR